MNKIKLLVIGGLLNLTFTAGASEKQPLEIDVYRSPSCGCCSKWITHLKQNQFTVNDYVTEDVQVIKDKYGVPKSMASCHTALVNGYVVEGHVPAVDIKKMLEIKPSVIGISVPGMPVGTPGMDMGGRKDAYKVVSFDENNKYKIFNRYEASQ